MTLWDAYLTCMKQDKNMRVILKDGETYEGKPDNFLDGFGNGSGYDWLDLVGPNGTHSRGKRPGRIIVECDVAEIEIIDRE